MEFSVSSISKKKPVFIVAEKAMDELCHGSLQREIRWQRRDFMLFDHKRRL